MRKKLASCILFILILCFLCGCSNNAPTLSVNDPTDAPSVLTETTIANTLDDEIVEQEDSTMFILSDYQEHTDWWSENWGKVNVGQIVDAETAIQKAKQIWADHLKLTDYEGTNVCTYYDSTEECWLIIAKVDYSAQDKLVLNSEPSVIIHKNGDILALWIE